MPDRVTRRPRFRPAPLLVAAHLTLATGYASADGIHWVGYQHGAPGSEDGWWRTVASWLHDNNVEVVNLDASDVDVDTSDGIFSLSIRPAAVPGPASITQFGLGAVALIVAARRRAAA